MKQRLHPIELTLMIVAALALTSGAVALHTQSQLAEKVVRLHVLANSDSEEDQVLKLKVRDAVLERATETLRGADDQAEARRRLTAILFRNIRTCGSAHNQCGVKYHPFRLFLWVFQLF